MADYNNDGYISLGDVTALARSCGMSCSGFRTEYSTEWENSGFSPGGFISYDDYRINMPNFNTDRRLFVYPSDTASENPYWMRVWAINRNGEDIGYHVFEVAAEKGLYPPIGSLALAILSSSPPAITWNTMNLKMADGNQDGTTNQFDLAFVSELFGIDTLENPQYSVMDYDDDGLIGVSDVTGVGTGFLLGVDSYLIELSTQSSDEGFAANGTVEYLDSAGFNANGFRYYEYTIASSPVGVPYWVRVTPVAPNGEIGIPSDAVEFGGS